MNKAQLIYASIISYTLTLLVLIILAFTLDSPVLGWVATGMMVTIGVPFSLAIIIEMPHELYRIYKSLGDR